MAITNARYAKPMRCPVVMEIIATTALSYKIMEPWLMKKTKYVIPHRNCQALQSNKISNSGIL
jgi:hypothetical protein